MLPSHSSAPGYIPHFWLTSCSPVSSEVFTGFVSHCLTACQAREAATVLQPDGSFGHKNCPSTALQYLSVPWSGLYLSLEITLLFFSIKSPGVISNNINYVVWLPWLLQALTGLCSGSFIFLSVVFCHLQNNILTAISLSFLTHYLSFWHLVASPISDW